MIILCTAPTVVYFPVVTRSESTCAHVLSFVEGAIFATATSNPNDILEEIQHSLDGNQTRVLSDR